MVKPQFGTKYLFLRLFFQNKLDVPRCLGTKTGSYKALMHHKFLVGLDDQKTPQWLLTGLTRIKSKLTVMESHYFQLTLDSRIDQCLEDFEAF
jgi:hypothetical protein